MSQHHKNPSKIVAKARENFTKGLTKTLTQRTNFLKSFFKFLKDNEEAIITAIFQDVRKHRQESRLEISMAQSHVRYLIDNLPKWVVCDKPPKRWVDVLDGLYVYSDPYGVVLVMCTWNVPLLTLLPAAGETLVVVGKKHIVGITL